jgi:hypothetical protein
MDDIHIPDGIACDSANIKPGKLVIAPNLSMLYNLDSIHGEPAFYADDKIIDKTKFYVVRGCVAYSTFEHVRHSSFCFVMRPATYNRIPLTQNGIVIPTPTAIAPSVPTAPIVPATQAYIFEDCAVGFNSD